MDLINKNTNGSRRNTDQNVDKHHSQKLSYFTRRLKPFTCPAQVTVCDSHLLGNISVRWDNSWKRGLWWWWCVSTCIHVCTHMWNNIIACMKYFYISRLSVLSKLTWDQACFLTFLLWYPFVHLKRDSQAALLDTIYMRYFGVQLSQVFSGLLGR